MFHNKKTYIPVTRSWKCLCHSDSEHLKAWVCFKLLE